MYQDQIAPHGYAAALGGRNTEQQEKWQQHIAMEQATRSLHPHGPLESAIDGVSNAANEAFSALDRLADSLHLVLQPELPSPIGGATGNACSTPPTSPAVARLQSLRSQLEVLTERMNRLNGRLDA